MSDSVKSRNETEYEFFVYEDGDDPRYSFWMQVGDSGMCLYDRPPEGAGMWLKPERDSEYDPTKPTDELKDILGMLLRQGVDGERLDDLPPHEQYFAQAIVGSVNEDPDKLPAPIWDFLHHCAAEVNADV